MRAVANFPFSAVNKCCGGQAEIKCHSTPFCIPLLSPLAVSICKIDKTQTLRRHSISAELMVPVPWVRSQAVSVGGRIPITTEVGVLGLADWVSACGGVDDGAAATACVVVTEAHV